MSASPATGKSRAPLFLLLAALVLVASAAFMTLGVKGRWDFVLPLRATKLATLLIVGYAIAISTVMFQTIANNRILTPSIMGLDALYILIQTALVFVAGSGAFGLVDKRLLFLGQAAAMTLLASLLYRWLFAGTTRSLHLLLLAGVILGVMFRSLSAVMQRMIDPTDFVVLQDRFFASFNSVDPSLLGVAAIVTAGVSIIVWRMLGVLDVLSLGRDNAVALGVDYQAAVSRILILTAILVSTSTALVGPVAFFGLLVANLAYQLVNSHRHALTMPAAVLLAFLCLVGGQVILERVFAFNTALAIIVEFVGGVVFLIMLVRGAVR